VRVWPTENCARTEVKPHSSSKRHQPVSKLSHTGVTFEGTEALHKVSTMIWKFLSLQKMLDSLFDDSWFSLGLPEAYESSFTATGQLQNP
jgi:hypothetical protein